jgi:hypothetical protein
MGRIRLFDYVIYCIILGWHFLRERPTNTWIVQTADVSSDPVLADSHYRKVEFVYTYNFEGKRRSGSCGLLFFSDDAARECAQFFVKGSHLRVRVNPRNPDESVIRRGDMPPY